MNSKRMAEILLNCRPKGGRQPGRPLKRLLDEVETGLSRSNWWQMKMITLKGNFFGAVETDLE
jgi:hypothetical protein